MEKNPACGRIRDNPTTVAFLTASVPDGIGLNGIKEDCPCKHQFWHLFKKKINYVSIRGILVLFCFVLYFFYLNHDLLRKHDSKYKPKMSLTKH